MKNTGAFTCRKSPRVTAFVSPKAIPASSDAEIVISEIVCKPGVRLAAIRERAMQRNASAQSRA
jgi:hypothetical protein